MKLLPLLFGLSGLHFALADGERVARASTPSGGITCYYKCPDREGDNFPFSYNGEWDDDESYCYYSNGRLCKYYTETGEQSDSNPKCLPTTRECNSTGKPSMQYFKRSTTKANRDPGSERIRSLQYQGGRKARRANKLKKQRA